MQDSGSICSDSKVSHSAAHEHALGVLILDILTAVLHTGSHLCIRTERLRQPPAVVLCRECIVSTRHSSSSALRHRCATCPLLKQRLRCPVPSLCGLVSPTPQLRAQEGTCLSYCTQSVLNFLLLHSSYAEASRRIVVDPAARLSRCSVAIELYKP